MERRELLRWIAAVSGCALVGGREAFAAAGTDEAPPAFGPEEIALLDEIAETIIPRTETPGARDAGVGPFMARFAAARYEPGQIAALRSGLVEVEAHSHERFGTGFLAATVEQRRSLLEELDAQARARRGQGGAPEHYYTLLLQLTLLGFFTSEPGMTKVLRYRPVPGRYQGCVPWHPGETYWS